MQGIAAAVIEVFVKERASDIDLKRVASRMREPTAGVGEAMAFLASNQAAYITSQTPTREGGQTLLEARL